MAATSALSKAKIGCLIELYRAQTTLLCSPKAKPLGQCYKISVLQRLIIFVCVKLTVSICAGQISTVHIKVPSGLTLASPHLAMEHHREIHEKSVITNGPKASKSLFKLSTVPSLIVSAN